ncbi:hypothetical protein LAZ67_8003772 [Cordylochernes scorpioides]|uniref:Mos1 transposase HTH domain-containing protein n=1 Tax=Cordylochernes scorpioides TaxID=51811 RepID=A0ABY6KSB5_9ARAC|nr:hypothetical protein LAZ67_8003772 [Cordylochernes scorpioides]
MEAPLKDCTTLEQRAVIRFLNAEGIQTSQICQRMKNIYGESCMSQKNIYKWVNEFKNGRITCTDIERPGRPSVTATPSTINAVENLILEDRKISIFTIGNAAYINHVKLYLQIIKLGFEVLEHPAYSPDLAPSDYFLFGLLKKELKGKRFDSDEDVQKGLYIFLFQVVFNEETRKALQRMFRRKVKHSFSSVSLQLVNQPTNELTILLCAIRKPFGQPPPLPLATLVFRRQMPCDNSHCQCVLARASNPGIPEPNNDPEIPGFCSKNPGITGINEAESDLSEDDNKDTSPFNVSLEVAHPSFPEAIYPQSPVFSKKNMNEVTKKARVVVKLFKRSPLKNEILLNYMRQDNRISTSMCLILDCRTRWDSLLNMLERLLSVKSAIQKALIDVNANVHLTDEDFDIMTQTRLLTAEATVKFLLEELQAQSHSLSKDLQKSFQKRILEERCNKTSLVLQYLHNPQAQLEKKKMVKDFSVKLLLRLKPLQEQMAEVRIQADNSQLPRSLQERHEPSQSNDHLTIERRLQEAIEAASSTSIAIPTPDAASYSTMINHELNIAAQSGKRGPHLESVYQYLLTIPPTSVESWNRKESSPPLDTYAIRYVLFEAVPNMEADAFAADSNMSTDAAPPYPWSGTLAEVYQLGKAATGSPSPPPEERGGRRGGHEYPGQHHHCHGHDQGHDHGHSQHCPPATHHSTLLVKPLYDHREPTGVERAVPGWTCRGQRGGPLGGAADPGFDGAGAGWGVVGTCGTE